MATFVLLVACGHGGHDGTTADEKRRTEPQPIARKDCSGGTSQTVDVNNDGRPDITHHTSGGKRTCSEVDLNFDGKPDLVRFYEDNGEVVRFEQHDYDFDGKPDDNDYFKAGKIERKELDTNFDGLIDTWLWCSGPIVEKAERARRKPGRVDTWESYQNGQLAEVQYDENNDGKVEKWDEYRQGSLYETKVDTNDDGKPDRNELAESDGNDQIERVSCDGTTLPPLPQAAATPAAKPSTASVFGAASDAGSTVVTRDQLGDAGVPSDLKPVPAVAPAVAPARDAGAPSAKGDAGR